eukprot:181280-Hanusia_phi.AAC.2
MESASPARLSERGCCAPTRRRLLMSSPPARRWTARLVAEFPAALSRSQIRWERQRGHVSCA